MSNLLLAGAARTDVTPPVGIDIAGFCLRGLAPAIHQPLYIRAAVFGGPEGLLVLVSCELVGLTLERARALRDEVGAALSIPVEHVLIACTHTHSAPALDRGLKIGGRQEEWTGINEAYAHSFRYQVLSTVRRAHAALQPARAAGSDAGVADIGVNRRFRLPSGRMILGRNWEGPVDRRVGVLRVESLAGEPICTLVNYACHPIVLGATNEAISPDYPGETSRVVEAATGAPCLFLQGCCADIGPVDGMGSDLRVAEALGAQVGYEALKVRTAIETRNIVQREEIVESYNALANLVKEEQPAPPAIVRAEVRRLRLPMLALPPAAEIAALARREIEKFEAMQASGASEGALNIQRIELRWVRALQQAQAAGITEPVVEADVQALRVNNWALIALPVEPFVRIGLTIKERVAPTPAFVVGMANGTVGYSPMPEDYPHGGYEVERAHHVYGRATALAPACAGLLIDTGVELVGTLFT